MHTFPAKRSYGTSDNARESFFRRHVFERPINARPSGGRLIRPSPVGCGRLTTVCRSVFNIRRHIFFFFFPIFFSRDFPRIRRRTITRYVLGRFNYFDNKHTRTRPHELTTVGTMGNNPSPTRLPEAFPAPSAATVREMNHYNT